MNIIFLDIDGVLNSELFYRDRQKRKDWRTLPHLEKQICKERLSWIYEIVDECNAKIVISSTWRHDGLQAMKDNFAYFGFNPDVIIGCTPHYSHDQSVRGNEIAGWIKQKQEVIGKPYYEYRSYAIIDDDSDMLYDQRNNFFQTDTYVGLTPNICHRIKLFFNSFK